MCSDNRDHATYYKSYITLYLVHDALEAEGLGDLDGRHGVPHVHLVGEEQDRDLARTDVGVLHFQTSCDSLVQTRTESQ